MSNERHGNGPRAGELRSIDWRACFPFMRIFGAFQMAVQPGKIALAVAAVVLTGLWGVILDGLHPTLYRPVPLEIDAFWQTADLDEWRAEMLSSQYTQLQEACRSVGIGIEAGMREQFEQSPDEVVSETLRDVVAKYREGYGNLERRLADASRAYRVQEIAEHARPYNAAYRRIEALGTRGVFCSFVDYQARVGRQLLSAASVLNFAGNATNVLTTRVDTFPSDELHSAWSVSALAEAAKLSELPRQAALVPVDTGPEGFGVIACVVLALRGVQWLLAEHLWYFVIFAVPVLVLWALFGGAIYRMAALNAARDERIPLQAALDFAWRKISGFVTAPLFPVGLVLLPGVALFLGGLIMGIPGLGELLGGLGLGLALLAGGLIALVLVGAVAGGSLLWPTIAVEGSDGFDAISRSYSYVFARPWRAAFYAAVALVYGAICYLFVRFFILLALKAGRFFVGAGVFYLVRPGTGSAGATKIDTLWPAPTWENLLPTRSAFGMENLEGLGAILFSLWLMLVIALLWAFIISFYASASTVIYGLLRQRVDGTDFDDVYIEADEQPEWPEPASEEPPAEEVADETGVAPSAPPERVSSLEPEPEPESRAPAEPPEDKEEDEEDELP